MTETSIQLVGTSGEPFGRLRIGALALVAEAEQVARAENLAKRTALPRVLLAHLREAGFDADDAALAAAVQRLDQVRRGQAAVAIQMIVRPRGDADLWHPSADPVSGRLAATTARSQPNGRTMANPTGITPALSFFELERVLPDPVAQAWYERLVGLDEHKARFLVELEMLLYPDRLEEWSRKHHRGQVLRICELHRNRVPLVLLEGDVGTGKTALAETIGDALARRVGGDTRVHLLKINTQVRGTGQVGEMSDLIVQAFTQAEARARSLGREPVLLLLDEADALTARRDTHQMHHEDKAGLNTVLQRLDNLRLTRLPLVAVFITNRPEALDPAIRRRAALNLRFERPGDQARAQIIRTSVPELAIGDRELAELVRLTGEREEKNVGVPFTASDLTDRLLPGALRAAFREQRALQVEDLRKQAQTLAATPPMATT